MTEISVEAKKLTEQYVESLKEILPSEEYTIQINIRPLEKLPREYEEPFGIFRTLKGTAYSYLGSIKTTDRNKGFE